MSKDIKLSKSDVRNPDFVTEELKKGFKWSTEHTKIVVFVSAAFILLGLTYSGYQFISDKNEEKAQESFFKAEKDFLKTKENFDKYENTSQALVDFNKNQKSGSDKKNKKQESKATPPKVEGIQASGDIEKDYGSIIQSYKEVIQNYKNSKAAKLAAIELGDLSLKYNKPEMAVEILKSIPTKKDLLSAMILNIKGQAESSMNNCKTAVDTWDQVLQNKTATFMYPEVRLKQGLCFEALNDFKKAEETYNKVMAEAKDGAIAKSAEKYLRLLKLTEAH